MRALYQRRKGRDLFDLAIAIKNPSVDPQQVVAAFSKYMEQEGNRITRALFEKNMADKLVSPQFTSDIQPLLASGYTWQMHEAARDVSLHLISLLE